MGMKVYGCVPFKTRAERRAAYSQIKNEYKGIGKNLRIWVENNQLSYECFISRGQLFF